MRGDRVRSLVAHAPAPQGVGLAAGAAGVVAGPSDRHVAKLFVDFVAPPSSAGSARWHVWAHTLAREDEYAAAEARAPPKPPAETGLQDGGGGARASPMALRILRWKLGLQHECFVVGLEAVPETAKPHNTVCVLCCVACA